MKITKKSLIKLIEEELIKHSIAEEEPPADGGDAKSLSGAPAADPEKKGAADIERLKVALTKIDTDPEIAPAVEVFIGHVMDMANNGSKKAALVLKNLRSKLQQKL